MVRLKKADLPAAGKCCGTAQLSSDEVIVIGGWRDIHLGDVHIGTLQTDDTAQVKQRQLKYCSAFIGKLLVVYCVATLLDFELTYLFKLYR